MRLTLPRRRRPATGATTTEQGFALRRVEVEAHEGDHRDLLRSLEHKEIDAVLVRSVFTPPEIERALGALEGLRAEAGAEMFGHVLGTPILQLGNDEKDRSRYFASTVSARRSYRRAFGFDPHDRVASVLGEMSQSAPVSIPHDGPLGYNPGTIRWFLPGQGGLYPHAGNEFVDQNEQGALAHLLTINQVREWMSWFVVLQRPESGGTLTVFDLLHEDRPPAADGGDPTAREALFGGLARTSFDPEPGTLIAFCGGWRYHSIEQIGGSRPRITYGGFMRPDRTGQTLHLWA